MISWMQRTTFFERWSLRVVMIVLGVVMLFPFVYVLAVSLSSYPDVVGNNLVIFPLHPTLSAYSWVFQSTGVAQGFLISLFVAVVGTVVNMVMTATLAYGLSCKNVPASKVILWLVLLTLLIAPSLITRYLVVRQLHMIDTLWALIIPGAIAPFNLIVLRQFFISIPDELIESAKLDGANDVHILWHIILPLSKASLAAISLFYAVANWNSFFDATMFVNSPQYYPLSVILRLVVMQGGALESTSAMVDSGQVIPPDLTMQMAVVVIATIPILLVYPFLQKYFTKGVLTGSIKG